MKLIEQYNIKCQENQWSPSPEQIGALNQFAQLQQFLNLGHWQQLWAQSTSSTKNFNRKGIYIWGKAGRGKTMIMDLFFLGVNKTTKIRQHFHQFMLTVQNKLTQVRESQEKDNPIKTVAQQIIERSQLLCLDELQITNIADAMIIGRLFSELLAEGGYIVITSNSPPEDLYKNGLNRAQFLPFIDIINQKLKVINIDGSYDYRKGNLQEICKYFFPLGEKSSHAVQEVYQKLTKAALWEKATLLLNPQPLTLLAHAKNVGVVEFTELCERPLGTADYLSLSNQLDILIILNTPQYAEQWQAAMIRFAHLVDIWYDQRKILIITAAVDLDHLLPLHQLAPTGTSHWQRAISRLYEMQSPTYR